jgi:hypothetical protein
LKGGRVINDINDFTGKSMLYIIGLLFIVIYCGLGSYGVTPMPDWLYWIMAAYGTVGFIGLLVRGAR